MIPSSHVYGHHPFQGGDSPWLHPQPSHHQPGHQGLSQQQQQHYNRMSANHAAAASAAAAHGQDTGHENISEENRRTMAYVADLLNENTREAALLELSKKREQVPELALILWHSFGKCIPLTALSPPLRDRLADSAQAS